MVKSRLPQLTICEFEAYGKALPKLKFDGCSQGSNADDAKHLCHEAFDSSLAQCAITNSDNTWWKAQTSQPVWFMFVKIFSRAKQRDSLTNFEVLIDENVCNRYKDSTEFDTKILPCGGYGHEIMVRSHLPKLAICEFEAYGKVLQKLKLHGCRQGSSLPGGKNMCYKAYDGKTNEDGSLLNCARTGDRKTWWMAKTQQPVRFNYVKIYNQLKQREGLTDFEVIIDDKTVCNRYKNSTGFASKILKCDAYGQKIMVRSNRPNLTICEFEAYGETVPSEKKLKLVSCEQNTDRDNSTTCDKAIDNRLEYGKELGDHCAITSRNHSNTYWWARTEHPVRFTYVKLYDRLDFKNKQTDFDVLIDGKKVCTRYKPTDRFASKILRCDGYGQELKISTAAGQLTVCEFEAYGLTVPTDEKLKFVNCSQGSNWDGTNHLCNKAYDDKLDTSEPGSVINCAHTGKENTWWKAKTERPVRFKYVVIYNRATLRYRLTNFDVIIDEKNVCNRYQSIFFFAYKTMRCDGYGQEIMVKSRLPKLTICEFEAFGETVPTEDKIQLIGCRQGSNLNSTENLCDKAYDDKLDDPDNPIQNCAITNIDNTWWKAKTEYPVRFVYVKIYNRLTHRDTLTDFEVVIDERNVCNRYKNSTQFASKTLRCDGYGHEIMVRSHMPQLTICEFEAYGQKSIRHEKLKLVNCSQGSSLDGIKHSCDKAYDDKLDDPDNPIQNCAITNNDNTWWKAKTEHPVRFMYIKIYNRLTHRDTLTDFEVVIDETNVCNRYKDSTQFASKTLRCDASGQEIMVRSHLPKQLAICEIEAFGETLPMETEKLKLTNCSQGSDKFSSTSLCDRAYDNKLGDTLDHCALTNADNSWWRAQTEKPVRFIYVKIYNRLTKERQSRRTNLEVIIDEKKVCNRYTDSEYFLSKTLRCDGYGQEIMVKSNIPYLTLCEFEAYGESLPAEDKLPLTRCKQSSSYYTHTCEKAIDDRLEDPSTHLQTCAFVDSARAGWWRAATDYQVQFMMVKIYNRLNRRSGLTNFAIYIDEKSECSRYSNGEEFSSKALPCEGVGQEIMVKSSLGYLTICELEAFGKFLPQRQ
ncbi:hypothetical protein BOX15_Mlig031901g1 [Macrostomum lignano]|uniref:FTP domain-containing protein n=1 Tax=Macrostomum lignano TaxID=282301 RepID=A0A267ED97_9PLAT|nr:hypothetical protein BOX15_Mlig031901g1 [Macrostomum lignano]